MPAKIRLQTFKNGAALVSLGANRISEIPRKSKNAGWDSSEYRAPFTENYFWATRVVEGLFGAENVVNGNTIPQLC